MSEGLRESVYISAGYSGLAYKWQWVGLKEAGGGGGEAIEDAYGHIENFSANVGKCRDLCLLILGAEW